MAPKSGLEDMLTVGCFLDLGREQRQGPVHRNCPSGTSGLVVPISIMILALPPLLSIINRARNLIRAAATEGLSGNHAQERPRSPKLK